MIITILIFIIILGILVFVHESGHFIVARKSGMKVDEFGFGFPPRMVGIQKTQGKWKFVWGHREPLDPEQTVYSINWIPLGGFVKIMGENNEGESDPRSFINRPFWGRLGTLLAGVTMNWILAALLFAIIFTAGTTAELDPTSPIMKNATITNHQVAVSYIAPGGPAEKAGLMLEDFIESVDGKQFASYEPLQKYIIDNKGKTFEFVVKRIDQIKTITIESLANPGPDQGPTGIALTDIGTLKLPWYRAIPSGIQEAAISTKAIGSGIYHLFTSKQVLNSVGGPIKIAQLTGQVAKLGFVPLLRFMALLSINLAVLNVLPFPALDGGRVLFLIIEKIRGKRNNQKIEQWVNTVGFMLLLLLMLVVSVKDIIH
jgi:regulator of sigma E protease